MHDSVSQKSFLLLLKIALLEKNMPALTWPILILHHLLLFALRHVWNNIVVTGNAVFVKFLGVKV